MYTAQQPGNTGSGNGDITAVYSGLTEGSIDKVLQVYTIFIHHYLRNTIKVPSLSTYSDDSSPIISQRLDQVQNNSVV